MTVRPAAAPDAARIAAIVNEAFEVEREFRPGGRTNPEEVLKLIEHDAFLVAEEDGRIDGAVHVRATGTVGYFGMLAVAKSAQGKGLGKTLTAAAEDYCRDRGCTVMTMSTGEDRRDLVAWYQRLGYRLTSSYLSDNPAFNRPLRVVELSKPL